MIERLYIDNDGPDGTYLVIEGDLQNEIARYLVKDEPLRFRLYDENLESLDGSLQPWREHMAEGDAVREEREQHKRRNRCAKWVFSVGPCQRIAGHDGDCDPTAWEHAPTTRSDLS